MRRIVSVAVVLMMVTVVSFGQEKFTTYENTFLMQTLDISVSVKGENNYTLWIDMYSIDKLYKKVGISVNKNKHQDLTDALINAKAKYLEWKTVAEKNNVTEMVKTMKIRNTVSGYFHYGGKWKFQSLVRLGYDFKIITNSKGEKSYVLIVRTGELVSGSNQFMKVDGGVLTFVSTEEIDLFIESISPDKIDVFLKKPKEEDLFKD